MHQHPRQPPKAASPALSPQTNPTRTNNPREGDFAGEDAEEDRAGTSSGPARRPSNFEVPTKESVRKLDQIIQNFYLKAAVVVLQARINTTVSGGRRSDNRKANKWFQLETDDIDDFRDELRIWKNCGSFDHRAPPLIIETYLDTSRIPAGQSLVLVDEDGKRWDVSATLASPGSSGGSSPGKQPRRTELILERWRFELKYNSKSDIEEFGLGLPIIYKRSIVFFRSLFTSVRLMPAYKLCQSALVKDPNSPLQVKCRVLTADEGIRGRDTLRIPLTDDAQDVTIDYMYGDLETPVGRFYASTCYRERCNFRIDDSDSLLSSRLMGDDEDYFRPSIPMRPAGGRSDSTAELGSVPSRAELRDVAKARQTYGSLSTFHGEGALGTSPFSALKATRNLGHDTTSPPGSIPASAGIEPPSSLPASRPIVRPPLRGPEGSGRRPSVSFQPFKAGSLSSSPRVGEGVEPPSPRLAQRQSGISALAHARSRNSLTAGTAATLRGGPPPTTSAGATAGDTTTMSSSPRPASSRISSSFSHRKGRLSFGGQSRTGEEDQNSSGKGSVASSLQPGSGLLAEAGHQASSGSLNTDDDNISDFLKALDNKKTLQSFDSTKKTATAVKRTSAQLSRFQMMKESNNALTESMISSTQLQRSPSTSSRQLGTVPGMAPPHSTSMSSSPAGKPLSPHTPHTPAVPSRLSENSIVDHNTMVQDVHTSAQRSGVAGNTIMSPDGTTAIDIPLSPRVVRSSARRSSSVAQRQRALIEDEEAEAAFGPQRSSSVGAAPEQGSGTSTLFRMEGNDSNEGVANPLQPSPRIMTSAAADSPSPSRVPLPGTAASAASGRLRYQSSRGGRPTPPHSSRGSFAGSSGSRQANAPRGEGDVDEEEPLVFDMSEIGRRSMEEGRGGHSGGSSIDRTHEPRGVSRRGW